MVRSFPWRVLLAAVVLHLAVLPPASAQPTDPPAATAGETQPAPLSPETRVVRARLDGFKLDLEQTEAALRGRELSGADLQGLRARTDPIADELRVLLDRLAPRLEAARARLEQLGPKPKEDAPESPDLARERAERERAVAEVDDTQRLARALQVQAEQLMTSISDRRRAGFTRALLEPNASILNPELWMAVAASLPRDVRALRMIGGDWLDRVSRNATFGGLILLGLAVGAALALFGGRWYIAPRLVRREPSATDPPQRRRVLAAAAVLLVGAVPAAAGAYLVYLALEAANMMTPRVQPVIGSVLAGVAVVAAIRALGDSLLAPRASASWRLVPLSDDGAERLAGFATLIGGLVVTGKVVEALNGAIAAPLSNTVATRGLFAVLIALALAELLRRFAATAAREEEPCLGPYIPTETEVGGPAVRVLGWVAVAAIAGSALIGYAAFASFLVDQLVWVAVLAGLFLLAIQAGDEFVAGTLKGETRVVTALQANTGLRRRSLQQIGVLVNGLIRLVLVLAAVLLALAPWGVDSYDLVSSLRGAVFGFKVGDVTISLSTIAVALLVFAIGFVVTRVIRRWLESTFLPATDLDAGLRNSISTAFGYLGIFVALALAFSYLGLSLDKIAIVAGALSVGIGFGLQSIVNNFVSGLILLWERPIRVGDLVVVGDGEGYVQKISVRATEILTFDRSTVIVPNSNLISGVVRNRVRGNRTGRVVLSVSVLRSQDPVKAAEILVACAREHRDIVREPPPRVLFKKIGETWLEFDLIAFVSDVNLLQTVQSDLNFAAFGRLTEAGMIPPLGPGAVTVEGLGPVETALEHIAGAIAAGERAEARPAESPRPRGRPQARAASDR